MLDSRIFIKEEDGNKIIVVLYVDDFVMAASHMHLIHQLIAQMKHTLKVTEKQLEYCLGIRFTDDRMTNGTILLDLDTFTDKILDRFDEFIPKGRAVSVPIRHDAPISREQCPTTDIQKEEMSNISYRRAIG